MLIFGHKLIECEKFILFTRDKINKKCINLISSYDENLIKKLKNSGEKWAIYAKNKDEIFLSNALKADFILLEDNELAIFASKVAEFYLFDSKILLILDELKNLEKAYSLGVDGVVLRNFIR